jgi:hypothetical protein
MPKLEAHEKRFTSSIFILNSKMKSCCSNVHIIPFSFLWTNSHQRAGEESNIQAGSRSLYEEMVLNGA